MSQAPYHGSCLCGAIKYEVDALEPKSGGGNVIEISPK